MKTPIDNKITISYLKQAVARFVQTRGWKKFHSPKNLAESICIESSELLEIFQWRTLKESMNLGKDSSNHKRLAFELADVIIYCLALANATKVDISSSVISKLEESAKRYPISRYRGKVPHYPNSHSRKT